MNREEAKHFSDVLKAYSEGKEIEVKSGNGEWGSPSTDELWFTGNPMCYRIKPEPKYRPYANAEEFLKAQKEHGPYIILLDNSREIPIKVRDAGIEFVGAIGVVHSYKELFRYNNWQDGTPCKILEE